ncbi:hypothetical protein [uncultured Metabacillus sp.]|uniref:hypothetical protein n=1 Tax=uncultured Metabacillus sp. TaxID=2860135 RepID=UPI002636A0EB|nr:hypothetical protein [uncultured Metabacillus sp.]
MPILANLPYSKVTRWIEENRRFHKELEYEIVLTTERLCTSFDTFLLKEVLGISYRFFSENTGFLYLHTTKGMYSYTVKTNPEHFINQFKQIKHSQKQTK